MDAELIAIGRVRRAVAGLSGQAQMRVLQYVVGGLYEAEQTRQRTELERMNPATREGGIAVQTSGLARMSEARAGTNQAN